MTFGDQNERIQRITLIIIHFESLKEKLSILRTEYMEWYENAISKQNHLRRIYLDPDFSQRNLIE